MVKALGLGRGLGSLIPNKKIAENIISKDNRGIIGEDFKNKVLEVPVELVEVNPHQPRQVFDHAELEELIESIKQHGIIQPLIVTKTEDGYQLIAGERRLRSAKIIGLNTVPVLVREAGEQEKLELSLIENIQRKNLNPIEKAYSYQRLMDEFNLSQEASAKKLGINRSVLANTVRFLELPEDVQKALASGDITEGHAKVIAGLDSEKEQLDFLKKISQYNFTVRDAEKQIRKTRSKTTTRAVKSPELEEKEDLLRSKLNTKVFIKKNGKKGQIMIDFYSDEEMNYIISEIIE